LLLDLILLATKYVATALPHPARDHLVVRRRQRQANGSCYVCVWRSPSAALSCSTTGNFTTGGEYQVNLVNLTNQLPQTAIANRGFSTGAYGQAPDVVYGLAMCYIDHTWSPGLTARAASRTQPE
jgi:hypothetical protein